MRFSTRPEAESFFLKLGVSRDGPLDSRGGGRLKTFDVYYQSPLIVGRQVSEALAIQQGNFEVCLLWAHELVWGDRSREARPPPGWQDYRRWREALGEEKPLRETPGHLFQAGEHHLLADLIELAIIIGWDALIAAKPTKAIVHLSHDDRISLYTRTKPSELLNRLIALGLRTT